MAGALPLTPDEKATRAIQLWCVSTDPPPIGMDLGQWISIVEKWSEDMSVEEINIAGRNYWGRYWSDISE